MTLDLLLRALRKCERRRCPDYEPTCHLCNRYLALADKIHEKIVERFEKMKQAGKELCLDKWVREQQEKLRYLGE